MANVLKLLYISLITYYFFLWELERDELDLEEELLDELDLEDLEEELLDELL
jgi:hypothetical protein